MSKRKLDHNAAKGEIDGTIPIRQGRSRFVESAVSGGTDHGKWRVANHWKRWDGKATGLRWDNHYARRVAISQTTGNCGAQSHGG